MAFLNKNTEEKIIDLTIPNPFIELQIRDRWRYKLYHGGRGGGKSESFARTLLIMGINESLSILCCREHLNSIENSVYKTFRALIQDCELPYRVMSNKIVSMVNKTEIIFGGLSEMGIDAIKSLTGIDICWVEEAHFLTRRSIEILTPTIRKPRSEIWFSFNRQAENDPVYMEFCSMERESCFVRKVNYDENPFFSETPLESERLEDLDRLSRDDYNHKWLGYPETSTQGSFYGEYIRIAEEEERICKILYSPFLPVYTAWDFGFTDSMAIWFFQVYGKEVRFIEYFQDSRRSLVEYFIELNYRAKESCYRYAGHFVPHDASRKDDRYKLDRIEIAKENGIDFEVVPIEAVEIGIERCRNNMYRCFFDTVHADLGIKYLKNYKRRFNKTTNMYTSDPLHDESSHCADAFRYAIRAVCDIIEPRRGEQIDNVYSLQNMRQVHIDKRTGEII